MRFLVLYGVFLALVTSYRRPRVARWTHTSFAASIGGTRSDSAAAATAATPTVDVVTFAGAKFGAPLSTSMRTLGITEPTPIQKASIAPLTAGLTCILHAQTGSGKTLTYLLPLLKRLLRSDGTVDTTPLQGLIIVPTKELAVQVAADVAALLSKSDDVIDCSAVHLCLKTTRAGFDDVKAPIVVGTPFKILDALKLSSPRLVRTLNYLVLDEVDRMLVVLSKYASNDDKREARAEPNPAAEVVSLLVKAKLAAQLPPMQVVAASATVGRPLRRDLFRLLQGGEEFGDITVLRPSAAEPAADGRVAAAVAEEAPTPPRKRAKKGSDESIEDLEAFLEAAMGEGAAPAGGDGEDEDGEAIGDGDSDGDSEYPAPVPRGQTGSTRKVGIPRGIRHVAILTRDDSNVLNSKVVAAKEKWVGEYGAASRGLLFVPRSEDVKQIIGMLQFWGVKEAQNLQESLGIEVETRAQQIERASGRGGGGGGGGGRRPGRGRGSGRDSARLIPRDDDEDNDDGADGGGGNDDESADLILRAARSRLGATSRLKDASSSRELLALSAGTSTDARGRAGSGSPSAGPTTGPVNGRELFVAPVSGSRGLHLQDIEYVLVLSPPRTMDEYLHMAGRTGRAGNKVATGTVVSLVSFDELKRMQSWQTALDIQFEVEYE